MLLVAVLLQLKQTISGLSFFRSIGCSVCNLHVQKLDFIVGVVKDKIGEGIRKEIVGF